MNLSRKFLPALALLSLLCALGACSFIDTRHARTVDATAFQRLYNTPRRYDSRWDYEGMRGGYAYLARYGLPPTTDIVEKRETVRCPVAELPRGFPAKPQPAMPPVRGSSSLL